MLETGPAITADMPLPEVIERLSRHERVDALLVAGSAAAGRFRPGSDYDLVLVLRGRPPPASVLFTYVAGRITDLILLAALEVDELLASQAPVDADGMPGKLLSWARSGRIEVDKSGRLARLRQRAAAGRGMEIAEHRVYSAWFSANYNLAHNRRMLGSGDPVTKTALRMRLLFSIHELIVFYFTVRGMPWRGEKEAVRYLREHAPAFLQLVGGCLAEPELESQFSGYEELFALTFAPIGSEWAGEVTAAALSGATDPDTAREGLELWEELLRGPAGEDSRS